MNVLIKFNTVGGVLKDRKVVIVDDHPVFRQGLRDVLETDPGLQVIGEAANGEVAMQMAEDVEPDVMLIDINLPDLNGLQVTRQIRAKQPEIKIVVITGYDDAEQAFHAIRAGASAYCPKDVTPETLIQTLYEVQQDRYVVGERRMNHDEVVAWGEEKVGRLPGRLHRRLRREQRVHHRLHGREGLRSADHRLPGRVRMPGRVVGGEAVRPRQR